MASLSSMTTEQLKSFIDEQKAKGKTESTSKQVGKAVNLLKVKTPEKYGAKQVASAKESLIPSVEVPNLQKLGITNIPSWKVAEQQTKDLARNAGLTAGQTSQTAGITAGMTQQAGGNVLQSPEIVAAQKEIDTITSAKNQATANINDNPFYSEATRVGKIAKLNEKFNADLNIATTKLTNAQTAADRAYKMQQDAITNNREMLKTYISTGALAGATEAELQQISRATGYPINILKGAIQQIQLDRQAKLKNTEEKPLYDWNKISSSDKSAALMALKNNDAVVAGSTPDTQLSKEEYADAVDELLEKVGDLNYAIWLIDQSMSNNGYTIWGQ
jgi:hypothetical protein